MGKHIFSKKLRFLLEDRGITQQQLAAAVGVNQASVHAWTKESIPRGDALQKIAETLGTTMEWLLTDEEPGGMLREDTVPYGLKLGVQDLQLRISQMRKEMIEMAATVRNKSKELDALAQSIEEEAEKLLM